MTDLLTDGLRVLAHAWPGHYISMEVDEDERVLIHVSDGDRWEPVAVLEAHLRPGHGLPTPGEALAKWRAGK